MRRNLFSLIILGSILISVVKISSASDLNNILQGVLGTVSAPKNYTFHAGDKIYSKMEERLYYSGYEYSQGKRILLLTYVENGVPILLKFPEPDVIQVKELKLKVIEFNNQFLRLEQIY